MIDSSIPYFDVVMVRPQEFGPIEVPQLPEGFAYKLYTPGDIAQWSRIEDSVNEFETQAQARSFFMRFFMSHEAELERRMVFVVDEMGKAVADATAWWAEDDALGRVAQLHWVAAMPGYQGKGLGRAVTCKALSLFETEGPQGDIWLTTQTWSHVAIGMYLSLGFCAHRTWEIAGHKNGFDGAVEVLRGVMKPEVIQRFVDTAIG